MNSVETILLNNIDGANSLFVFPTEISLSGWADHLLKLNGGTISMNKFIAWDEFKQNSIKSKVKNKRSIPSALRKIFVSRLVAENAQLKQRGEKNIDPIFTSLIKIKWAENAQHFTPWLTGILPQLGAWFNKTTSVSIDDILSADERIKQRLENSVSKFEGDDKDMYILARRYAQFLDEYSLFEPAWETPPFNDDGKNCFIFFPESLADFCEYKELLSKSENVKIISAANTDDLPSRTFYYTNARREITEAALYIRALHEKQNIAWDSIVLCLPDSENYEPYVIRELTNRNIPFVKRTSKPLTDFPAGQFFRSVIECAAQDFSFSSFISLVLNKNLPWKNTEKINNLINFGIKNNCISSWTEEKDEKKIPVNVWEDAFKKPFGFIDDETRDYFYDLKKHLKALRGADSFSELLKQYFIFRALFFNDEYSEETDLVLSRSITELIELTELEKAFPKTPAIDPFLFLTEHLSEKNYLAQSTVSGVAILPYKTAAASPFDCHIILGAGQNSMSVVYSRLYFLPRNKREQLGLVDEDASAAFIELHKFNSKKISAFFCSEQTFSGYEIPHSKINAPLKPKNNYCEDTNFNEYFSKDYYLYENDFDKSDDLILHENQRNGFLNWKNRRKQTINQTEKPVSDVTIKYIKEKLSYNPLFTNTISVSASALKTYYQCSLFWLYERILDLDNVQIETSLMEENLAGTVYHAVLDLFFKYLKENNLKLPKPDTSDKGYSLPKEYKKILNGCLEKIFSYFPYLEEKKRGNDETNENVRTQMSALTSRFLYASKYQFLINLENCLSYFMSIFSGCAIKNCEKWYQLKRGAYFLNGKSDLILEAEKDNYIIVDFKLGKPPNRKDCTGEGENGLSDLQLPMYIMLAENNENIKITSALFFSIIHVTPEVIIGSVQNKISDQIYPKKEEDRIYNDSEKYKQIFEEFENKTRQFADEITTGNLSVFESNYNECYNCRFNRICRRAYSIKAEKNIFQGIHN